MNKLHGLTLLLFCIMCNNISMGQHMIIDNYDCIDTAWVRASPSPNLKVRQTKIGDTVYSQALKSKVFTDTIHYKQLSYSDFRFKAKSKPATDYLHMRVDLLLSYYFVHCTFDHDTTFYISDTMFYRIEPIMHKNSSWLLSEHNQKEYLVHAQIHFDYLELTARQFREELTFWCPYMKIDQIVSETKKWHQKFIHYFYISYRDIHSTESLGWDKAFTDHDYNDSLKTKVQRKLNALSKYSSSTGYILLPNIYFEPIKF
jgi:hypothetical protein